MKGVLTMLSYTDFLVRQEQYKDLLREAERDRLFRSAGFRRLGSRRLWWRIADLLGVRIVRWGRKLQRYGTTPPSYCSQVAECQ